MANFNEFSLALFVFSCVLVAENSPYAELKAQLVTQTNFIRIFAVTMPKQSQPKIYQNISKDIKVYTNIYTRYTRQLGPGRAAAARRPPGMFVYILVYLFCSFFLAWSRHKVRSLSPSNHYHHHHHHHHHPRALALSKRYSSLHNFSQ